MWVCSFGVPECPICKRYREEREQQAKREATLKRLQFAVANGSITVKVDRATGKVTFQGVTEPGVSDECLLRALQVSGSALALAKIDQAQRLAGRAVTRATIVR